MKEWSLRPRWAERKARGREKAVGPSGRYVARSAEVAPVVSECLDVRHLISFVRGPKAIEPGIVSLAISWCGCDERDDRGDGAIHRSAKRAR